MNFIGHYYHALEQKGRIAIPAPFRSKIGSEVIISRGIEECLYVFTRSVWNQMVGDTPKHPFGRKIDREWIRLVAHKSRESAIDSQGRILLADHLLAYAHLEKECVVVGSVNYLEIWDRDIYHRYIDDLEKKAEKIMENK